MALGTAAPLVLGSLLVTAKDEGLMKNVRGLWEHSAQSTSPQLPHHLQPELLCPSAASVLANTFLWAASLMGPFPRGALCQALHPCLSCGCAQLQGSIPAALLMAGLPPP